MATVAQRKQTQQAWQRIVSHPDWPRCMADLRRQFVDTDLQGQSEQETLINVGMHKVVMYMWRLQDQRQQQGIMEALEEEEIYNLTHGG